MKKHLSTLFFILIFLIGLSIFLYPTVSNLWNEHLNSQQIIDYTEQISQYSTEEQQAMLQKARSYNEHLLDSALLQDLGLHYEDLLNINGDGVMGYLEIPKISVSLVIYHGTEDKLLQDGIGHVETSALPVGGSGTHSVLAGHTGLPSAKLLTNLDRLEPGDVFYIHILNETLEYRITDLSVVEPNETDQLRPEEGKDLMTIVTCTPYGINTHRLLVRGIRASGISSEHHSLTLPNEVQTIQFYIPATAFIALLAIGYLIFRTLKKKAKKKGGDTPIHETKTE